MKKNLGLYLLGLIIVAAVAGCGSAASAATPAATATTGVASPVAPTAMSLPPAPPTATTVIEPTATTAAESTATPLVKRTARATPARNAATPLPATTPAAASSAAGGTPAAIVDFQQALLKQKAYRSTSTVDTGAGITLTDVMEVMPPDRVHLIASNVEQIVIRGVGAWQKVRGGQWQVNPGGQAAGNALLAALDPSQINPSTEQIAISQFKSLGREQLNGKPMQVYQYTTTVTLTATGTVVQGMNKTWVGVQDGLPYKSVTQTPNLGNGAGSSTRTTVFEYDVNIDIQPPL